VNIKYSEKSNSIFEGKRSFPYDPFLFIGVFIKYDRENLIKPNQKKTSIAIFHLLEEKYNSNSYFSPLGRKIQLQ
jgi:hypothetical protein